MHREGMDPRYFLENLYDSRAPFGRLSVNGTNYDNLVLNGSIPRPGNKPRKSSQPVVVILIGPPGCGKSTISQEIIRKYRITDPCRVDPDNVREILMTNGVNINQNDPSTMSGITNFYNERLSTFFIQNRVNFVFDTTGRYVEQTQRVIDLANEYGYRVIVGIVYASLETCVDRVDARNRHLIETHSRRIQLPIPVAEYIYEALSQEVIRYEYYEDLFMNPDDLLLYNNDTAGEPVLLLNLSREEDYTYTKVEGVDYEFKDFYGLDILPVSPYITQSTEYGSGKRRRVRARTRTRTSGKATKQKTRRARNKRFKKNAKMELLASLW